MSGSLTFYNIQNEAKLGSVWFHTPTRTHGLQWVVFRLQGRPSLRVNEAVDGFSVNDVQYTYESGCVRNRVGIWLKVVDEL